MKTAAATMHWGSLVARQRLLKTCPSVPVRMPTSARIWPAECLRIAATMPFGAHARSLTGSVLQMRSEALLSCQGCLVVVGLTVSWGVSLTVFTCISGSRGCNSVNMHRQQWWLHLSPKAN
jgi:hypothetical protein